MHIVVCCKQVPEISHAYLHPERHTLLRDAAPGAVNPCDYAALECALRVKDDDGATTITLLTMGPPAAAQVLIELYAFGADRAILLTDPRFAGADTFATGHTLAAAVRMLDRESPVDLVLCGARSLDGATGHLGPGLARHLGWPSITACQSLQEVTPNSLKAVRAISHGTEMIATRLPAVLCLAEEAMPIRYASLPGVIRAQRYTPELWSAERLEVDPDTLGAAGAHTRVVRTEAPARAAGVILPVEDLDMDTAMAETLALLTARGMV